MPFLFAPGAKRSLEHSSDLFGDLFVTKAMKTLMAYKQYPYGKSLAIIDLSIINTIMQHIE